jgi:hypothetical protein
MINCPLCKKEIDDSEIYGDWFYCESCEVEGPIPYPNDFFNSNERKNMRNRAKCKLCDDVIESKFQHDYVTCKCGEISVDGGNVYHRCRAANWDNFLRVDDEDNIVIPKIVNGVKHKQEEINDDAPPNITIVEKLDMLKEMAKSYDNLPPHAMTTYITNYEFQSLMLLLSSILEDLVPD